MLKSPSNLISIESSALVNLVSVRFFKLELSGSLNDSFAINHLMTVLLRIFFFINIKLVSQLQNLNCSPDTPPVLQNLYIHLTFSLQANTKISENETFFVSIISWL